MLPIKRQYKKMILEIRMHLRGVKGSTAQTVAPKGQFTNAADAARSLRAHPA
jgi:hypothetical protein